MKTSGNYFIELTAFKTIEGVLKITFLIFLAALSLPAFAQRNKGGWMECRHLYDRMSDNTNTYSIIIYVLGSSAAGVSSSLTCFDAATGARVQNLNTEPGIKPDTLRMLHHFSPCPNTAALNNNTTVTYVEHKLTLPANPNGYFVTISGFGRDPSIVNIYDPAGDGILYFANIKGIVNGADYHTNSAPVFSFNDTFSVCKNLPFTYQVQAVDPEGDSLSYRLGDAIQMAYDTTSPPLTPVQYAGAFTGADPLGTGVTINPVTGLISGISPGVTGGYTIAVYAEEWRNGVLLRVSKKESQIKVTNCPFKAPMLKPVHSGCRVNTFTFANEATCPDIMFWHWNFGVPGITSDTSNLATPTFTYPPGPGTYNLQLKVSNNYGFIDSATALVKILDSITVKLPADTAICTTDTIRLSPVSDGSSFVWRESGGGTTLSNYFIQNPKANPSATNTIYYVQAQLNNCVDSTQMLVHASPYPKANAGTDTVICIGNSVTLQGQKTGAYFTWSPATALTAPNTLRPIASPQKNIAYVLAVRDTFYCPKTIRDTVNVKVVAGFTADAGKDVNIVYSQPYQLHATTIGNTEIVRYQWSPATFLNNATFANPYATITNTALETVRYKLTATTVVGNCSATDEVVLRLFKTGPDILVPSGFTPNGDGNNDVLKPILIGIEKFERFSVYNRFGQLVFTTTQSDSGWNGKINGNLQTAGAYLFMAEGKDYTGKQVLKKGTILLIR